MLRFFIDKWKQETGDRKRDRCDKNYMPPIYRYETIVIISVCDGLETLWKKEKMMVTCIFSFSQNVFKSLYVHVRENLGLFGEVVWITICTVYTLYLCPLVSSWLELQFHGLLIHTASYYSNCLSLH